MPWNDQFELIQQGEPVAPSTDNRPLQQIIDNLRYLKNLVDAAATGKAVILRQATAAASVQVGQPVYYHAASQRFEAALAGVEPSADNTTFQLTEASLVWGVVLAKNSSTSVDIVLSGVVEGLDLSAAVEGSIESGLYYLSAQTAGQLVRQEPPISVPVLQVAGNLVYVRPTIRDFLQNHTHYRFELVTRPAGEHTPPSPGQSHTIANPDPDLPGWLPADHAIFEGRAPAGAAFGYNLSQHPELANLWPPLPPENAYLEWCRGESYTALEGVPLGSDGLAVIDRYGIWWMTDCYGDVPWPTNYDSGASDSDSLSGTCPVEVPRKLVLWFNQLRFSTSDTIVKSLRSRDDRLRVTCLGGTTEQAVGDLELSLDLNLALATPDTSDLAVAVKELDEETGKLKRGPVVSGIYTTSDRVALTGETSVTIGGVPAQAGLVRIDVHPESARNLAVRWVAADDVTEESYPTLYLGFPPGINSNYQAVLQKVPENLTGSLSVTLRFWILGTSAGTLPALTLEYYILTRPSGGSPASVPNSWTPLSIDTAKAITANGYIEVDSDAISVNAGDQVVFRLSRTDADAYAGMVGVVEHTGVLSISS
mgnify:CR=1 FL=1